MLFRSVRLYIEKLNKQLIKKKGWKTTTIYINEIKKINKEGDSCGDVVNHSLKQQH